jgi:hypothetical protein
LDSIQSPRNSSARQLAVVPRFFGLWLADINMQT